MCVLDLQQSQTDSATAGAAGAETPTAAPRRCPGKAAAVKTAAHKEYRRQRGRCGSTMEDILKSLYSIVGA